MFESAVDLIDEGIDKLLALDEAGLEPGELNELLGEVQRLANRLDGCSYKAVGRWDRRLIWDRDHAGGGGAWLAHRHRIHAGDARARVREARRLERMPLVREAFEAGLIGRAQVRHLSRAWSRKTAALFARDEALLVGYAKQLSERDFGHAVRKWVDHADPDAGESRARRQWANRRLDRSKTFEGAWAWTLSSDPLSGAAMAATLDRFEQKLFEDDWREARQRVGDHATASDLRRTPPQRRHDALLMALEAAKGQLPGKASPLVSAVVDGDTLNRALERILGINHNQTLDDFDPTDTKCELLDGTPLTPGQVARLALAGHIHRVLMAPQSQVLDMGRTSRLFSEVQKRAMAIRDRTCTLPSCEVLAGKCEADHIVAWANSGHTDLANGSMLCGYHHSHRQRKPNPLNTERGPDGNITYRRDDGTEIA